MRYGIAYDKINGCYVFMVDGKKWSVKDFIESQYQQGRTDAIKEFCRKAFEWNQKSSKKIPYEPIRIIAEQMKEQKDE